MRPLSIVSVALKPFSRRHVADINIKHPAVLLKSTMTAFSPADIVSIRNKLLAWYDQHHRVLPWRRNEHSKRVLGESNLPAEALPAPSDLSQQDFMYYVWVCEVMSQQTQVPRVVQYFNKWIKRWPTVEALSKASVEEVNEMWAGLGYYRRARYLLDGAKHVQDKLGGLFPLTSLELQKIPGVGEYTGNAMASIAGGEARAVVDGNVIRVLARLLRLTENPKSSQGSKLYASLAQTLLDTSRPGDFNQAMMELGAMVCTPQQPRCPACPIRQQCTACLAVEDFAAGGGDPEAEDAPRVTAYPVKVEKAKRRKECTAVCVVELRTAGNNGEADGPKTKKRQESTSGVTASEGDRTYLLVQRPAAGLLAGLWEFPSAAVENEAGASGRRRAVDSQLDTLFGEDGWRGLVVERKSLGSVVHIFSHIRMTMHVERLLLQADRVPLGRSGLTDVPATKWVSHQGMGDEGLSSGVRKVFSLVVSSDGKAKKGIKRFLASSKT
eukprot:jgi/Botrbrau1/16444/Bobra.0142s0040.1